MFIFNKNKILNYISKMYKINKCDKKIIARAAARFSSSNGVVNSILSKIIRREISRETGMHCRYIDTRITSAREHPADKVRHEARRQVVVLLFSRKSRSSTKIVSDLP